jgi:hypothetical protein
LWVQGVRLCIERRQRDIRGDSWQYILASAYRCRPVPRLVVHAIAMPVLGVDVSQSEVTPCLLRVLRAPVKDIEAAGGSPSAILSSSEHSRAFAVPCPPVDGHCVCSTRVPQACTDQQVGLRKFAKTSHSSFPKLLERVTPCAAKTPGPDRRRQQGWTGRRGSRQSWRRSSPSYLTACAWTEAGSLASFLARPSS